jgi:hypothetical protein
VLAVCVSVPIESDRSSPAAGVSPFDALPGLATALDEEAMRGHLQAAVFAPGYAVERCPPSRPLYLPGDSCVLRYRVEARDEAGGRVLEPLVTGRVFPDEAACAAYMRDRLAPLAARMRGRPEVAELAASAAVVEPLNTALYVWPIDGELPTLVEATDRRRMLLLLRELLAERRVAVEDCRVELVSYRRRRRCVLRYVVAGGDGVAGVLYGKVTGVGNATLASPGIEELRRRLEGGDHHIRLPRLLAWRPELQLALLEALPGEAQIRPAIRKRLKGRPPPPGPPLEELVEMCAAAAAGLHGSGVEVGPRRAFGDELAAVEGEAAAAGQFVPGFAARAGGWLERIAELEARSQPLPLGLAHGDFNHGQLLFDGTAGALLDLDTLCRAEPALDLGKFGAHLRFEVDKLRRRAGVASALDDELAERFLRAYVAAAGGAADEGRLRARTALYEALALVRLVVRSRHDFEETRFEIATVLLEERMRSYAADRLVSRRRT